MTITYVSEESRLYFAHSLYMGKLELLGIVNSGFNFGPCLPPPGDEFTRNPLNPPDQTVVVLL